MSEDVEQAARTHDPDEVSGGDRDVDRGATCHEALIDGGAGGVDFHAIETDIRGGSDRHIAVERSGDPIEEGEEVAGGIGHRNEIGHAAAEAGAGIGQSEIERHLGPAVAVDGEFVDGQVAADQLAGQVGGKAAARDAGEGRARAGGRLSG